MISGPWAGEDTGSPSSATTSGCAGVAPLKACLLTWKMETLVPTSRSYCKTPEGKTPVKHSAQCLAHAKCLIIVQC